MFLFTRDTFSTTFSIVVRGRAGIQVTPSISRATVDSASTGFSASGERSWFPFQRRVSFQKAQTQVRNLEGFQVGGCRMERHKDRDHAFLARMLFVLMFLWLSAFVCICFVCLSPFVSDGLFVFISVSRPGRVCFSVFTGLCLSVCLSRTSCVSCLLCLLSVPWKLLLSCVGLGCLVLSYLGLSCLVLSACHRSVLSLCDFRLVECLPLPAIHLHMVLFHILRVHAAIYAVASLRASL